MDKEQLSGRIAEVYTGMNGMHPFRGRNDRTTREFIGRLTKDVGYQLDYSRIDKQTWDEATKKSARGGSEPARKVFYEIATVERAVAFSKLATHETLAKHPELDNAYKMLHDTHRAGQDVAYLQAGISKELHSGRLVGDGMTLGESKRVINHAAAYRGLMVRDAGQLGGQFKGEVVAVSLHHTMLQVDDMIAVRCERANLDHDLVVGDRATIQHDKARSQICEQGKEPARDRDGKDMQMEREHVPTPR